MQSINHPFSLQNKNIIITGASSGIGRACAIACDMLGASLVLLDLNGDGLKETLSLTKNKRKHRIFEANLTKFKKTDQLFLQFREEGLKFHGLVNCAGISTTSSLRRVSPEKINQFIETNVTSAIYLSEKVSQKHFLEESGVSIVFIASVMSVVGEVGKTLYSLTKGALLAASRSMALELAAKKIRVNCISPGVVESPMSQNAVYNRDEEARKKIDALHPLGLGQPEDVANASVYLLSDAARWVTGTNLVIDGGYTAR